MNIVSAKLKDYIPPEAPSHLYAFNIHVLGLYFSKYATAAWRVEWLPLTSRLRLKLMDDKKFLYNEIEYSIDWALGSLANTLMGVSGGCYEPAKHCDDVIVKYWSIFSRTNEELGNLMCDKKFSWHIHFTPEEFVFTTLPCPSLKEVITRSYSNKSLPYALYQWALELVNSFEEKDLEQNVWLEPAQGS